MRRLPWRTPPASGASSPRISLSKVVLPAPLGPILDGVRDGDWAYFVHGYVCPDGPASLAAADYGAPVPAMVNSANRWGCQFHPERSAALGARILKNFLELPA